MSDSNSHSRTGFVAGGNFIVDTVKIIDAWPEQDALASITKVQRSNGGGPYNVLKNLSRLVPELPRQAIGLIGNDVEGDWISNDCKAAGIDCRLLTVIDGFETSATDVMTVAKTGRRTFFHSRGANQCLDVKHFDFSQTSARVFYLGYLMLLDSLDQLSSSGSTGAATVLRNARQSGLIAAVDCVSTDHAQFREIAAASLVQADVFLLNEVEASKILGRHVSIENVESAIVELMAMGARGVVVIHLSRGAFAMEPGKRQLFFQAAVNVPAEKIAGASGAGDAFATGFLYGVHEGWTTEASLNCGVCTAAMSLFASTPSDGLGTLDECLKLGTIFGYQSF